MAIKSNKKKVGRSSQYTTFRVVGLMSGTSLDGLDIALCQFKKARGKWTFKIERAKTVSYPSLWRKQLAEAHLLSGQALIQLHVAYGHFLGLAVKKFLSSARLKKPDFISSHGHTIFHQPVNGFTFQLGDGSAIFASCGIPVVCDFRSLDVFLGGEGAPLVPIGDRLLFSGYDVCVNLGGIANLSFEKTNRRRAFDICFVNMGLNWLANKAGKDFDKNGELSAAGNIHQSLLTKLMNNSVVKNGRRKSLGREDFEKIFQPLLDDDRVLLEDRMRTFSEMIGQLVGQAIQATGGKKVLLTGGGAHNTFLRSRIAVHAGGAVLSKAEDEIIDFKEALIFGFLGVLRVRGEVNVLRDVTGAVTDSISGICIGFGG